MTQDKDDLYSWRRDGSLSVLDDGGEVNRRQLYSICGKLIGHYPITGWLRVAYSCMIRLANEGDWNTIVPENV